MPETFRVKRGVLVFQGVVVALLGAVAVGLGALLVWGMGVPEIESDVAVFLIVILGPLVLFLAGLALFVLQNLRALRRIRIALDESGMKAELVRWRGPTPWPPAYPLALPYARVRTLERRDEIYRGWFRMPGAYEVLTLVTDAGERHRLVVRNPQFDPIPLAPLVEAFARRGVGLVEGGAFERGGIFRAMAKAPPESESRPTDQAAVRRANRFAVWAMQIAVVVVLLGAALRACEHL